MEMKSPQIITYQPPRFIENSKDFSVWVNDEKVFVYRCQVADYAVFLLKA